MREIRPGLPFPEHLVKLAFARSGGPGGQNVNKVETKVLARLPLGEIPGLSPDDVARLRTRLVNRLDADGSLIVTSSVTRSREKNREDALDRLCELVVWGLHRPKKRRPTKPSRGSKVRRLESKRRRSDTKRGRGRVDE